MEAPNDDAFKLRRISVELLLDKLHELYDLGVDFVDIAGEHGDGQDHVYIGYCKEYMDPDYKPEENIEFEAEDDYYETEDEEEDEEDPMLKPKKSQVEVRLTDSDINDLII